MATTRSKGNAFTGFSRDARTPEEFQRQFIQAPMDAARIPATGTLLELAALLQMLPDAFAASRQRELARVTAEGVEQDPRAERLQSSLDQLEQVRDIARKGRTRLERMAAVKEDDEVFHGFVTDPQLHPIEGALVRVTGGAKWSAVTDADGYFRIQYGTTGKKPAAAAAPAGTTSTATVEILQKSTVLHRDPVPIRIGEGRVYREYIITDPESRPSRPHSAKTAETPAAAKKKRPRPR